MNNKSRTPPTPSLDPRDYVSDREIRDLYRLRPLRIARDLALDWAVILGAISAWGLTRSIWVLALAFVLIAGRQHALNNWVHEGAHYNLSRRKRLNDWLCDIFAAAPHFISTAGYRVKHRFHHSDLGHPRKDTEFKSRYLLRGWHLWRRMAFVLFGGTALSTLKAYEGPAQVRAEQEAPSRLRHYGLMLATNGMLFGWCALWGVPLAWLYLWVLPLLTLTGLLVTLRVVAEHQSQDYAEAGIEQFDQALDPALTRTIDTDPVTAFFLAPVKFNYHFEHHIWPAIPYTSLPELSRRLHERGFYRDNPQFYSPSYYRALAALVVPKASKTKLSAPAST